MTVSIRPTETPSRPASGYPKERGVAVAAEMMGYTVGSLKQELYGNDRRAAVKIVETVIRETVRHGQPEVAETIMHRFRMAAAEVVSQVLTVDMLVKESECDGSDEAFQTRYQANPTPENWDALRRVWLKYRALLDQALTAGDIQHGRV